MKRKFLYRHPGSDTVSQLTPTDRQDPGALAAAGRIPKNSRSCTPGRAGPDGDHRHTEGSVREPAPSPSSTGQDPGSHSEPSVCPRNRCRTRRVRHRPGRRVRERSIVQVPHILKNSSCVPGRAGPDGDHRHTEGSVREPGPLPPSIGEDPGSRTEPSVCPRNRCRTRRVRHRPGRRVRERTSVRAACHVLTASPAEPAGMVTIGTLKVPRESRGLYHARRVEIPDRARNLQYTPGIGVGPGGSDTVEAGASGNARVSGWPSSPP